MICKNCGNENIQEAMFCEHCGAKLEAPAPEAKVEVAPVAPAPVAAEPVEYIDVPEPKKKGKAKLIIIIAAIVTFVAAIGVVGWFGFCAEYPWFVDESIIGIGVVEAPVVDDSKDKEEIEKMLEDYIEAAEKYDIEAANEFLTEEDDNLYGGGAEEFKEELKEECSDSVGGTVAFCESLVDEWAESRKMSVKDIEKDGDGYICTVEIEQLDEEEIEKIMISAVEDESDLIDEIRGEAIDDGLITGTEDELDEEIIDELNSRLETRLEEIYEEDIEALEPVTTETKVVVVKVDGEWKIDAEESELY